MTDLWVIFISCTLMKVRSEIEMSSATWYWLPTFLTYIFLLIYFIWLWKIARRHLQCCLINWTGFVIFIFPKGQGSRFGSSSSTFFHGFLPNHWHFAGIKMSRCFFPTVGLPGETPCSTVLTHIWTPKFPWILRLTRYCNAVSNKSHTTSSGISAF